jgi:hypothetical protein
MSGIAYMPSIRGNITERENLLLRRALDPATTENEAAKAMEAFVNSLRKRGLNGYDFVPPDPPRGRAAQEPPPEPPKSEPPPPKYEPKPPPPREETPPWWTRAKEKPPEPPPPPRDDSWAEYWKRNQQSTRERDRFARKEWLSACGCIVVMALIALGDLGHQVNKGTSSHQAVKPVLATPSPTATIFYIGDSYRIHFKNDWSKVGTIRGIADHIYELPDNPRPWDLYFCKATRDYWVSYLSSDGKQKWLEQPGFWLSELIKLPDAAPTGQGSSRSNPQPIHSDEDFNNLKPGTWWQDEAGNEGQK